jgi:hypothetical protein
MSKNRIYLIYLLAILTSILIGTGISLDGYQFEILLLLVGMLGVILIIQQSWYGIIILIAVAVALDPLLKDFELPVGLSELLGGTILTSFFLRLTFLKKKVRITPLDSALFILLIGLCISVSYGELEAMKSLFKFAMMLLLYWVMVQLFDEKFKIKAAIFTLFSICSLTNLLSLIMFWMKIPTIYFGDFSINVFYSYGALIGKSYRLMGFYNQPSLYGQILVIIIPLGFCMLYLVRTKTRYILIGMQGVNLLALFLNQSRSAILGMAIGCTVIGYFLLEKKKSRKFIWSIGTFTLIILAIWFYWNSQYVSTSRLSHENLNNEIFSRDINRIVVWKYALKIFLENPMGVGIGESKHTIGKGLGLLEKSPHNVIIGWTLQAGILGLISSILIIRNQLLSIYRYIGNNRDYELRILLIGCFGSSIASWIHNMFHSTLHWIIIWIFFAISSATVILCQKDKKTNYLNRFLTTANISPRLFR